MENSIFWRGFNDILYLRIFIKNWKYTSQKILHYILLHYTLDKRELTIFWPYSKYKYLIWDLWGWPITLITPIAMSVGKHSCTPVLVWIGNLINKRQRFRGMRLLHNVMETRWHVINILWERGCPVVVSVWCSDCRVLSYFISKLLTTILYDYNYYYLFIYICLCKLGI